MNRYDRSWKDFKDTEDKPLRHLQYAVEVALVICVLLLILALVQNRDMQDQITKRDAEYKAQKDEVIKYTGLLAECLNGGGMYDRASGTAYFCEKALEMRI